MKVIEKSETERSTEVQLIQVPAGLLGLEHIKAYELISKADEEPFVWLQSVGAPDVAFLLISPFIVMPGYMPDISDLDAEALGLSGPDDAVLFNIVTLRGASATVNLKGPIVINRRTCIAKQVVLNNASEYAVRHPINA